MTFPFAFQQFAEIRVGSDSVDRFRHLLTQFAIERINLSNLLSASLERMTLYGLVVARADA